MAARHGLALAFGFRQPSGGYQWLRPCCAYQWLAKFGKQLLVECSFAMFSCLWHIGERFFGPDVRERSAEALAYCDAGQAEKQRFDSVAPFELLQQVFLTRAAIFSPGESADAADALHLLLETCVSDISLVAPVRALTGQEMRRYSMFEVVG